MMLGQQVEWFLAPLDILPDTTITLGKLLVNPLRPEGPPYLSPALPIPLTSLRESNYPWTWEQERARGGMLGLFASFASNIFGIGGDVSGSWDKGQTFKIEVDRLRTIKFEPDDDYLEKTLTEAQNSRFLRETKFKKPVYIVTGVKVAYGACATRSKEREWAADGNLGVSPAAPGIEVGPKGSVTRRDKVKETIKGPVDLVFAFKLNKVRYSRRKDQFVQEAFYKGATYDLVEPIDMLTGERQHPWEEKVIDQGQKQGFEGEREGSVDEVPEVYGIESTDAGQVEFWIEGTRVVDEEDGEPCIAIPIVPE